MKSASQKGQLTTWKDERGFGFIKPDEGGKEVFLHISAVKGAGRRPRVGDTILYEKLAQPDGKLRAAKASIQGATPQHLPTSRHLSAKPAKTKNKQVGLVEAVVFVAIMTVIALTTRQFNRSYSPSPITSIAQPESVAPSGCVIKGNISISTGNKLYHLPGMRDYESTIISPEHGERWFCTEAEAIANGWRKAPR